MLAALYLCPACRLLLELFRYNFFPKILTFKPFQVATASGFSEGQEPLNEHHQDNHRSSL